MTTVEDLKVYKKSTTVRTFSYDLKLLPAVVPLNWPNAKIWYSSQWSLVLVSTLLSDAVPPIPPSLRKECRVVARRSAMSKTFTRPLYVKPTTTYLPITSLLGTKLKLATDEMRKSFINVDIAYFASLIAWSYFSGILHTQRPVSNSKTL